MLNSPHRKTVAAIVVVLRINRGTVEVQVVGVRTTVPTGRPIVAVRPAIVERRTIVVARRGEENPRFLSVATYYDRKKESAREAIIGLYFFPPVRARRTTYEFAFLNSPHCFY